MLDGHGVREWDIGYVRISIMLQERKGKGKRAMSRSSNVGEKRTSSVVREKVRGRGASGGGWDGCEWKGGLLGRNKHVPV